MKRFLALTTLLLATMFTAKAEALNVGEAAPRLTVTTETGKTLNLADVYSKGYTLIYFYPKAGTSGCTAQGCSLRDAYEVLTKRGVTVIGSSTDSVEDQRKFKEEERFPFTLVADTDKALMKAFGQGGFLGMSSRQAFLINKEGIVVWRDLSASTKEQANDVLKALDSLK
ncbi:peroxiredoxin [Nibricoccus sp. IMCC34717]|uniref:peroxiredoxin n=1 Tax=Nibricoccus sp. IMCC34717 TaxID=3034021 RepID=UPI00384FE230